MSGTKPGDVAEPDARGDPRQRAEAKRIVRPVAAVGRRVGIARPVEQMRRVEHEQIETRRCARAGLRAAAEQIVEGQHLVGAGAIAAMTAG